MALISKTSKTKWNNFTKGFYESKGYIFTNNGDEFEVKTEDLSHSSTAIVTVKCDGANCDRVYDIPWQRYVKICKNNKIYCVICSKHKEIGFISFQHWCIENNRQDVLDRWDYDMNGCKPSEISYATHKKFYFKCPRGIHESELKGMDGLTTKKLDRKLACSICNSFTQYGIDNIGVDFLEKYWDYEKNSGLGIDPWKIPKGWNKKVWIKCQEKNYHGSYNTSCNNFVNGNRCGYCTGHSTHKRDSYAQYLINLYGENALELYWDYGKNTFDPWEVMPVSGKSVYIKCQEKEYHESYSIRIADFYKGNRCGYCTNQHGKVHPFDSLGKLLEDKGLLHLWSDKNKKSPYEYTPFSHKEVWWKCADGEHEDYKRKIYNSSSAELRCPECQYSKGENKINNYLISNKISLIPQKEFDGLIGLGGGNLSYDFYLSQYNLLIEYQGEQHENYKKGFHKCKKDFEKQQEHDRRKREYAKKNNIKLLEIWYWDFDNIEKILKENNIT